MDGGDQREEDKKRTGGIWEGADRNRYGAASITDQTGRGHVHGGGDGGMERGGEG